MIEWWDYKGVGIFVCDVWELCSVFVFCCFKWVMYVCVCVVWWGLDNMM